VTTKKRSAAVESLKRTKPKVRGTSDQRKVFPIYTAAEWAEKDQLREWKAKARIRAKDGDE
jgi:hypothetical protein